MSTTTTDRPTEILPAVPARRSIFPRGACPAPTATLPAVPAATLPAAAGADWRGQAPTEELPAVPTCRRSSDRRPSRQTRAARRRSLARHLRAALAGIALAAVLLAGLQLYAAQGIADARRAALEKAAAPAAPPAEQAPSAPKAGWLIEGTAVEAPSPLDLPRCTTSPDTPLPCLATISPDSGRAVVLEEDASLTAVVRR